MTYTGYLSGSEDAAQHKHFDRNSKNEDKGEGKWCLCWHNNPQDRQTHQLDASEEVHAQRTDLEKRGTKHKCSKYKCKQHGGVSDITSTLLFPMGAENNPWKY